MPAIPLQLLRDEDARGSIKFGEIEAQIAALRATQSRLASAQTPDNAERLRVAQTSRNQARRDLEATRQEIATVKATLASTAARKEDLRTLIQAIEKEIEQERCSPVAPPFG